MRRSFCRKSYSKLWLANCNSWSSLQISAWQLTMIVCKKFHADFRKSVSLVRADSPLHESASFHSKPVCKGRKAEYAKNVQWERSWLDQFSGCASQSKQCNERLDVRQICEVFFIQNVNTHFFDTHFFINHYIPKIRIWTKVELMEKMFLVRPLSISHSRRVQKRHSWEMSSLFKLFEEKKPAKLCSFLWIDYSKKICLKYLLGEYFSSFFPNHCAFIQLWIHLCHFFTESLLHTRHCQKGRKMSSDKKPF